MNKASHYRAYQKTYILLDVLHQNAIRRKYHLQSMEYPGALEVQPDLFSFYQASGFQVDYENLESPGMLSPDVFSTQHPVHQDRFRFAGWLEFLRLSSASFQ